MSPDVRILFMSGYTAAAVENDGRFGQGTGLLQKPFTPDALGAAVRHELDNPPPSPS
jgi:hypothetical protein